MFSFGMGGCAICTVRSRTRPAANFQLLLSGSPHLYLAFPLLVLLPITNVYAGTYPSIQWEMPAWLQAHWAALSWGIISGVLAYVFGFCSVAANITRDRLKWHVVFFGTLVLAVIQLCAAKSTDSNLPPLGKPRISDDGVILQTTPFTCVPAAAANIARILGVHATERELVDLFHTSRDGTFPAQVLYGFESLGINGRKAPEDEGIEGVRAPAMLFIAGDTHAVVYTGMRNGIVEILNPSTGRVLLPEWRLGQLWDGHALEFTRASE